MSVGTYERDHRLTRFRGVATPAVPANYWVSLHSADPGVTGASELPATDGYARVAIPTATGSWSAPATNGSVRQIVNAIAVETPYATATWATATHFGLWDAATGGNFIRGNALAAAKTNTQGDTIIFDPGALIVSEQ